MKFILIFVPMKRFVTSVLMIIYMAGAIGFSFSFHYCGGTYHGICFTEDTEADCCGSEMENDGCCEDKIVSAKFDDNHAPAYCDFVPKVFSEAVIASVFFQPDHAIHEIAHPVFVTNKGPSPPAHQSVPIYLTNRVLRI